MKNLLPKPLDYKAQVTKVFVGETIYALSKDTYVSPSTVGYSSCAVAFWGWSPDVRMSFDPLHGGHISFLGQSVPRLPNKSR